MSFYDSDDFNEEYLNEEEEESNAFEVTMAATFEGQGKDIETVQAAAHRNAEESIFEGDWELDEGNLIGQIDETGRGYFEFTAVTIVTADNMEEALDIAASSLSEDWELVGDPNPMYIDIDDL
jgi:hypothetical protein